MVARSVITMWPPAGERGHQSSCKARSSAREATPSIKLIPRFAHRGGLPMSSPSSSAATPPEAAAAQLLTQIGSGHLLASALQVVVRLQVPDRLADGSRMVADLAMETETSEDALYRVLRALATAGLFDEERPRRFALTAAGHMLRSCPPSSTTP